MNLLQFQVSRCDPDRHRQLSIHLACVGPLLHPLLPQVVWVPDLYVSSRDGQNYTGLLNALGFLE